MASAVATPTHFCQYSIISKKPTFCTTSSYSISNTTNIGFSWIHQLGFNSFSQWSCLRHQGTSISQYCYVNLEKKRRSKRKGVYASLFGVGAPEALVIGVVALLVFGPKGLAEVARTLGKTLRAFQPTIRELQDVSREFKSTLEREIGLDDIQSPIQSNSTSSTTNANSSTSDIITSEDSQMKVDPNGSPSTNNGYSSEDLLKITEQQLKAVAAEQQKETLTLGEDQSETQLQPQDLSDFYIGPPPRPQNSKSET